MNTGIRIHLKGDYFPAKSEIISRIIASNSKCLAKYCQFLELYYNYIFGVVNMLGFDLLRLSFQEIKIIVHRPNSSTWIFDFSSNLTNV